MTDVAVALEHGARNVAAATRVLEQAQVVCGPVASTATVWRVFDELDEPALARLAAVRATQRRKVWAVWPPARLVSPGWTWPGRRGTGGSWSMSMRRWSSRIRTDKPLRTRFRLT
ncbi:hypothetical protein [Micromonospora sp. DH14]|uniref:hypothetical protein n=1 Tax=Micromonospora sp. DH14 TaxID=3040120 RepID=UPI0024415B8D|nr:hypothetical protein [Micromonospora sp. DH14]MDG9675855.1 hypothetical protein [Micromonospora sp. DH14]